MKRIINNIKYIKFKDLFSPFIFLIAFIPSIIFKIYLKLSKKNLWLISEQKNAARDNGYYFYKYVREKHPNDYCFYAIDKKCHDYVKVKGLGNIIEFGSLKHWIYYMSAKLNISNQKNSNPNEKFWYVMHVMLHLYNNRVFLQHGITINKGDWLKYENTHFKYIVSGAKKEYNFIVDELGYPNKNVLLTGFPRWDTLNNKTYEKNKLLIMPTWRNWLGRETNSIYKNIDFINTAYYKNWNNLLNSKEFIALIEKNNYIVYFYPHINMQKYLSCFKTNSNNIKIIDSNIDIQEILKECYLMITDYSSVSLEFGHMKKPVIYYQFDYDEYRKKQLNEGYYSYINDGYGPVNYNEKDVIKSISEILKKGYNKKYTKRAESFFDLNDKKNSERLYNFLKK